MKYTNVLFLALSAGALALSQTRDASACGGCFHEMETTQVVGHRMILSVSQDATTLWDQVKYTGEPQSFAWVLPIKGQVTVGVSSDALFQVLDQTTQVTITNPPIPCNGGPPSSTGAVGNGGAGGMGGGGVVVINEEVVGPYESVQLSSQDPMALTTWLTDHGYQIPANIAPVIAGYVNDGFDFLALKLVPGKGVDSMKPVRVTTAGAGPVLPLRMVAAGTGVSTAVQLWVFGEGRYEPKNFPSFVIDPKDVVWDWDAQKSNYSTLKDQKFTASGGKAWLVDFAGTLFDGQIKSPIEFQGIDQYADEMGMNAQKNLDDDMLALYGSLDPNNTWVTHMDAMLSQAAFGTDLQLQASANQSVVSNYIEAGSAIGKGPCDGTGGTGAGTSSSVGGGQGGAGGGQGGAGGSGATGGVATSSSSSGATGGKDVVTTGGCNVSTPGEEPLYGALGLSLLALASLVRRRRRA